MQSNRSMFIQAIIGLVLIVVSVTFISSGKDESTNPVIASRLSPTTEVTATHTPTNPPPVPTSTATLPNIILEVEEIIDDVDATMPSGSSSVDSTLVPTLTLRPTVVVTDVVVVSPTMTSVPYSRQANSERLQPGAFLHNYMVPLRESLDAMTKLLRVSLSSNDVTLDIPCRQLLGHLQTFSTLADIYPDTNRFIRQLNRRYDSAANDVISMGNEIWEQCESGDTLDLRGDLSAQRFWQMQLDILFSSRYKIQGIINSMDTTVEELREVYHSKEGELYRLLQLVTDPGLSRQNCEERKLSELYQQAVAVQPVVPTGYSQTVNWYLDSADKIDKAVTDLVEECGNEDVDQFSDAAREAASQGSEDALVLIRQAIQGVKPPTATPTSTPTNTPWPTATPTPVPTSTPTPTPTPTRTPEPTVGPLVITWADVANPRNEPTAPANHWVMDLQITFIGGVGPYDIAINETRIGAVNQPGTYMGGLTYQYRCEQFVGHVTVTDAEGRTFKWPNLTLRPPSPCGVSG